MYDEEPGKPPIVSPTYLSFMVRMWRLETSSDWLASLEAPGTHERHNFADMASFFAFLQAQTGTAQDIGGSPGRHEAENGLILDPQPP
jgi:hypothetical protein